MVRKHSVFLGSSTQSREVAGLIFEQLKGEFMPKVWDDTFSLSKANIGNLLLNLNASDFGVFILSDDDMTLPKGHGTPIASPRDNVVFEAGLFVGRLGMERCFLVIPDGIGIKIPSDLDGIAVAKYSPEDLKNGNHKQCVTQAVLEIRKAIRSYIEGVERDAPYSSKLNGLWLSRFKFQSSQVLHPGVQYNIENLNFRGTDFSGTNILGWNTIKTRKYIHQLTGRVEGRFLMGTWRNTDAHNVGSFQFSMNASMSALKGFWLGSDSENKINNEAWQWKRIQGDPSCFENAPSGILFANPRMESKLDMLMDGPDEVISHEEILALLAESK